MTNVTYFYDQLNKDQHTHQFHNMIQKWFVNDICKIPMDVPQPPLITKQSNLDRMQNYGQPMAEIDRPNPEKLKKEEEKSKKRKLVE